MFTNNNNNKDDRKSVNTTGVQLMNSNSTFCPSTIIFGGWDNRLTFKIHPALDKSQRTEKKIFDYQTAYNTALDAVKTYTLFKRIKHVIIPAILANEDKKVGIDVNGNSLVTVGTMIDGELKPYIAIIKNIDPDTKKPESVIYYEFNKSYSIEGYDEKTLKFDKVFTGYDELELMMTIMEEYYRAFSNATTHTYRTVEQFFKESLSGTVKKIAEKSGISVGSTSRYPRQNVFGSASESGDGFSGMSSGEDEELPFVNGTVSSGSVDDINQFLD